MLLTVHPRTVRTVVHSPVLVGATLSRPIGFGGQRSVDPVTFTASLRRCTRGAGRSRTRREKRTRRASRDRVTAVFGPGSHVTIICGARHILQVYELLKRSRDVQWEKIF